MEGGGGGRTGGGQRKRLSASRLGPCWARRLLYSISSPVVINRPSERPPQEVRAARELVDAGVLEERPNVDGNASFALTLDGLRRLEPCQHLLDPSLICYPRENIPLSDYTTLELVAKLMVDGWEWQQLPRGTADRQTLCYEVGGRKIFYSVGKDLVHQYLMCLLTAPELKEMGVVSIPHWHPAPVKAYTALLAGGPLPERKPPPLALELDVDTFEPDLLPVEDAPIEDPLDIEDEKCWA
eukprot:9378663-Pyramimonas_sp.AAC.2